MLRFPDCNQYLRKKPLQSAQPKPPKRDRNLKKGTLGRLLKNTYFSRAYFSANVLEKPPKQDVPPVTFGLTFQHFFRTWLARVAQTPKNVICYTILLQKSCKSCIGLLFHAFLLHRFCLHTCACASVLVHLFSPFVGYVFPSSCYQRQSSRMMCKTGWCGDATPQASSIIYIYIYIYIIIWSHPCIHTYPITYIQSLDFSAERPNSKWGQHVLLDNL